MSSPLAKKVLLIGWDAADWKVINPLLDQGLMPTLDGFINQGVMGNLATLRPILSPMLWNSIATGKRANKHGIHGFMEPDPQNGGIRPVSSTSRKVKAIWNILTQRGFKTHVLGWFAGHPAEPINGISISDLYPYAAAPADKPWPLPPGAVYPERLRDTFAGLRMHPGDVTEAAILPWIPRAAEIDQEKDKGLMSFAKILSENCSIHNAATWILQNEPWDFMAVYYNGIDHFCHGFMHYHPPRMEGIPEERYEIYKDVVNGAYRFHDMMLETLLELAGPDATVLLVSDHGFHSDHLRPRGIPAEPAGPAIQHRPFGIFCMKGRARAAGRAHLRRHPAGRDTDHPDFVWIAGRRRYGWSRVGASLRGAARDYSHSELGAGAWRMWNASQRSAHGSSRGTSRPATIRRARLHSAAQ